MISSTAPETIYNMLKNSDKFPDITFVVSYENEIKPTPVDKPIVAISAKGCSIGEKLSQTLETGEIVETNKREVNTSISIDFYMPYSMGGLEGNKIFDKVVKFLIYEKNHNIKTVKCSEADYDKSCQAIVLRSVFTYTDKISQ